MTSLSTAVIPSSASTIVTATSTTTLTNKTIDGSQLVNTSVAFGKLAAGVLGDFYRVYDCTVAVRSTGTAVLQLKWYLNASAAQSMGWTGPSADQLNTHLWALNPATGRYARIYGTTAQTINAASSTIVTLDGTTEDTGSMKSGNTLVLNETAVWIVGFGSGIGGNKSNFSGFELALEVDGTPTRVIAGPYTY